MRRYEQFLETVKEANPEQFEDLQKILELHTSQVERNEFLKDKQKSMVEDHDQIALENAELDA